MDDGSVVKARRRLIPLRAATAKATAPYGRILGRASGVAPGDSGYYHGKVAISKPVTFQSDSDTCLSLATIQPRPFELEHIERHYKHTQAFIPLGGKPFIAVFGAPTAGDEPDFDKLEAFRFDGTDGFCMHIGTWHEFPFALEPDTDIIVVLRNETNRNLAAKDNGEAHGDDLSKLNVLQRTGAVFAVKV
ncbi:MAG: ureidoglycolate lyase [Rhodospirillaceae bacterium]|nr:ureidoglycolate lyase [Rhodospirillaceae bacterium]